MKIVLKRESGYIEFFNPTQKHIGDILKKEKVEDLTAEFLVFANDFKPEISFKELQEKENWKQSDYDYYVSKYITVPAMAEFAKAKRGIN